MRPMLRDSLITSARRTQQGTHAASMKIYAAVKEGIYVPVYKHFVFQYQGVQVWLLTNFIKDILA